MKSFLFVVSSVLLPAAAIGQVGYVFDQGPEKGPEGPAVSVPAGAPLTRNFVADLVTFTQDVFPKKLVVYSPVQPGMINFEVRRFDGSMVPREVLGQGFRLFPMIDLGPVPGSSTGLRAWERTYPIVDGLIPAGKHWLLIEESDRQPFSLATVRGADDDVSYTLTRSGGAFTPVMGRQGDLMVQIGMVPEPASLAVLGLGLAALRRRKRG